MGKAKITSRTAFVAMKFQANAYSDRRYQIIADVLHRANYDPIRADEISTSGGVVDEVGRYLRESPLVVIDSSGDSHSVSYEIGYCHGAQRSPETTILLRHGNGNDIPFNYQHFRHHLYRSTNQLRRTLREALALSRPLRSDQIGYWIVVGRLDGMYGTAVANSILESLKSEQFSGRCEYYVVEQQLGAERQYVVGLGLRYLTGQQQTPPYKTWLRIQNLIGRSLAAPLHLEADLCEFGRLKELREQAIPRGVVEFRRGKPITIITEDFCETESWFVIAAREAGAQSRGS